MKAFLFALLSLSLFAHAGIIREIKGVQYNLNDDFDTADGECVLRGYEYASGILSVDPGTLPIVQLKTNGEFKTVIKKDSETMIISSIDCE